MCAVIYSHERDWNFLWKINYFINFTLNFPQIHRTWVDWNTILDKYIRQDINTQFYEIVFISLGDISSPLFFFLFCISLSSWSSKLLTQWLKISLPSEQFARSLYQTLPNLPYYFLFSSWNQSHINRHLNCSALLWLTIWVCTLSQ